MAIKQLKMVAQLEQEKEDRLVRDFQTAQQNLDYNQQKLNGIEEYRMDYVRQLQNKANDGINIGSYGHYQTFIAKLEDAIRQQLHAIDIANQVVEQRRQLWFEQQRKRKAVELLIERHNQAEQEKENRVEQALLDEVATQRFFQARKS